MFRFVSFILLSCLCLLDAKLNLWNFKSDLPLRDYIARKIVGEAADNDCSKNYAKYGVNIFNFTQPLDQFDPNNKIFWSQQVQWKNTSFKPNPNGDVVFLMIGGEGPLRTTWMCFNDFTWSQLAEEHGAFMFQLEHRFFGSSVPKQNLSVANLKWLTIEQALADINAFIPAMNKKFGFNKPKWVTFGGSYPGTMNAYLRLVYPNITNGNVASSAPIWAKIDFFENSQKTQEAIEWESSRNPKLANCTYEVKVAFEHLKSAVYSDQGREELNSVFNIQPKLGSNMSTIDHDVTYFMSTIFNVFTDVIQNSYIAKKEATINRTGLNVGNLCEKMVDGRYNYTERLYNVYAWDSLWQGNDPTVTDNDYWGDLTVMQDVRPQRENPFAYLRGYMWLMCNELGWLQTTDNGYGIFQDSVSLNFYIQYCSDIFDSTINSDYIQKNVAATLQRYGLPWEYNASNIVLPNGSLDPWSTLGCNVSDLSIHRTVRTTVGGSHCVDMYAYDNSPDSIEPADVLKTLELIRQEVAYFINQTSSFDGPKPTTSAALSNIHVSILIFVPVFISCLITST